jgi:hypothetical protein
MNKFLLWLFGIAIFTFMLALVGFVVFATPKSSISASEQKKNYSEVSRESRLGALDNKIDQPLKTPNARLSNLENADDLFGFYQLNKDVKDISSQLLAAQAASYCGEFFVGYDEARNPPDIFPQSIPDALSSTQRQQMIEAKNQVFTRCKGFFSLRKSERIDLLGKSSAMLVQFSDKLEAQFKTEAGEEQAVQTIQDLIENNNVSMLNVLTEVIAGQSPASTDGEAKQVALKLALCDYSDSCKSDSNQMLLTCMSSGICGSYKDSIYEASKKLPTFSEQNYQTLMIRAEEYRKKFFEALRSNDARKLVSIAKKSPSS